MINFVPSKSGNYGLVQQSLLTGYLENYSDGLAGFRTARVLERLDAAGVGHDELLPDTCAPPIRAAS